MGKRLSEPRYTKLFAPLSRNRERIFRMPMMGEHPTYKAPTLFIISVKENAQFPAIFLQFLFYRVTYISQITLFSYFYRISILSALTMFQFLFLFLPVFGKFQKQAADSVKRFQFAFQ